MMNMRMNGLLAAALVFGLSACSGDDTTDGPADPGSADGTQKGTTGKGDAWDWRNDPARFKADLNYKWKELPQEGKSKKIVWADTYWPTYEDSINARWLGDDVMSPAEKWDVAFGDWTPPEGFMDLQPYNSSTCEWDPEYYESLGDNALWVAKNKGNWNSHNGVDDDGDEIEDKDECGWGDEKKDRDGVETWWGICHAWVPAASLEDEPKRAVERNGVTFEVADMKALMVMQYDRSDAYMLGGRCNEADVERDENGRLTQSQCRDVNAGSFHVIVTNFLGLQGRPIAEDRTYDYEVWNQPVVAYEITEQEELSLEEVNALLKVGNGPDEDALPVSSEEKDAVLRAANELDEAALTGEAELRTEEAAAIIEARGDGFADYASLEAVFEVGPRVLARLLVYSRAQGWAPEIEPAIYSFNDKAASFVRVRMTLEYITEADPLTTPTSQVISRYTRSDRYEYILEIDENDEVIGGEWVGSSISGHPDFLWLPIRARSGSPYVDLDKVMDMVRESRDEVAREIDFGSADSVKIPDNDPEGVVSEVVVTDEGSIETLLLDVDIEHTYRGDLLVQLEKVGSATVLVFDGYKGDNRWEDNLELTAESIAGFEGVDLKGTWRLKVYDSLEADTGELKSWSIKALVK